MNREIVLGVTGLRRTGKTVFLTTLIHQLTNFGSDGLDAFANHGVVLKAAGKAMPSDKLRGMKKFPYSVHLGNLRQQLWPAATTDEMSCAVSCNFLEPLSGGYIKPLKSAMGRIGLPTNRGEVTFHIHDYPGEYLLDAPLLNQTFANWSDEALDRISGQQRVVAAKEYLDLANQPVGSDADDWIKKLREAYAKYLVEARKAGLEFFQPAMSAAQYFVRFELANTDGLPLSPQVEELPFVPLGQPALESGTPAIVELEKRFQVYRNTNVLPFVKRLGKVQKQIVLVDVLRVLKAGPDIFNDTSNCLRAILECYRYGTTIYGGAKKVLFAATKADHATKEGRPNLGRLLDKLVKKAAGAIPFSVEVSPSVGMTAICATTDEVHNEPGFGLTQAVVGRRKESPNVSEPFGPGKVPPDWPDDDEWKDFLFPEFCAPKIPSSDEKPWPNLSMDRLIWFAFSK